MSTKKKEHAVAAGSTLMVTARPEGKEPSQYLYGLLPDSDPVAIAMDSTSSSGIDLEPEYVDVYREVIERVKESPLEGFNMEFSIPGVARFKVEKKYTREIRTVQRAHYRRKSGRR